MYHKVASSIMEADSKLDDQQDGYPNVFVQDEKTTSSHSSISDGSSSLDSSDTEPSSDVVRTNQYYKNKIKKWIGRAYDQINLTDEECVRLVMDLFGSDEFYIEI